MKMYLLLSLLYACSLGILATIFFVCAKIIPLKCVRHSCERGLNMCAMLVVILCDICEHRNDIHQFMDKYVDNM